jgi:aspartate carbamoyltransferase catalytic subunit
MGKSLLSLKDLSVKEIQDILTRAQAYHDGLKNDFKGTIVANLFFEPSTRTHYSFIAAEHKLNCKVLDFAPTSSSLAKGETFYDTVKTFVQFGISALVIRSVQNA